MLSFAFGQSNIRDVPCLACGDVCDPVVVLECADRHVICTSCFADYARSRYGATVHAQIASREFPIFIFVCVVLLGSKYACAVFLVGFIHVPNIYKDTKPFMLSLLVFNRVYRLDIQPVMLGWYFRPFL
jgi:hypothetical protein